jgi:hypothetical protein
MTGKGLAAHLEVPLPYLLYRAQTRYEEDLRGLQDIRGALGPPSTQTTGKAAEDISIKGERPSAVRRASSQMAGSRLSSSSRLSTPLGVRARLNSLGNNSQRPKKATSSSTLTVQGTKKILEPLPPTSPSSSEGSSDSSDEEAAKEETERHLEEQEALEKKLKDLQNMMTNDALGFVNTPSKGKGKTADRGRFGIAPQRPSHSVRQTDELSSRSQSISSTSSPQGSIPSIPSPPPEPPHSPISRHLSVGKSSSPPTISARSARGQSHLRHGKLVSRTTSLSEHGSNNGSSASSFSDLSGRWIIPFSGELSSISTEF